MQSGYLCRRFAGQQVERESSIVQGMNELDFGQVTVHDQSVRLVHVINAGRVPLDFAWSLQDTDPLRARSHGPKLQQSGDTSGHNGGAKAISIRPAKGSVAAGQRQAVELAFAPTGAAKLKHLAAVCKIANGKQYTLQLAGHGHKPNLHLSWYTCDLGRVYTHAEGLEPLQKPLTVRNDDAQVRSPTLYVI